MNWRHWVRKERKSYGESLESWTLVDGEIDVGYVARYDLGAGASGFVLHIYDKGGSAARAVTDITADEARARVERAHSARAAGVKAWREYLEGKAPADDPKGQIRLF